MTRKGKIMDSIREQEQPKEPRRGIAPFAGGIEDQEDGSVTYIKYKSFLLRDIGKFYIFLTQPHNETLEDETNEDDRALTIDLAGALKRGNLRDFLRQGYFEVSLLGEYPPPSDIIEEAPDEELKLNLWINNTQTTIPFELVVPRGDDPPYSTFLIYDEKRKRHEHFVLPNNPELLKAVRINVSTKE